MKNEKISKDDIFFIVQSYMLEYFPELLPNEIQINMEFLEFSKDNSIKKSIIYGSMEIFALEKCQVFFENMNRIKDLVEFLYNKIIE